MTLFKVGDVRVRVTPSANEVHVIADGINISDDLHVAVAPDRANLMLTVFNAGRTCFWDHLNKMFLTDPYPAVTPVGPTTKGVVVGWEIRFGPSGPVQFQLDLLGPPPQPPASGNTAASWAVVSVQPLLAGVYLAVLLGKYAHYDNGALRNADASLVS